MIDSNLIQELIAKNKDKFDLYFKKLVEWNEKVNLTSITEYDEVFVKHFEDSLTGMQYVGQNSSVCDVGTGAGFPGIPLKIVKNDVKLFLFDCLNKRILFLKDVCECLGVSAECVHTRAEDAGKKEYREKFDVVTARAVAKLNSLCEYCLPLVKVGGKFLAYKTPDKAEIQDSERAVRLLGGQIVEVNTFNLSNGDSRSIIVIEKVSKTPQIYPRGKGIEKVKPL